MAGYNWLGKTAMSNNACTALEEGLLPLHKITRQMVDALGGRGLKVADVREAIAQYDLAEEWHHTGCNFKKTLFCSKRSIGRAVALLKSDNKARLFMAWKKRGYYGTMKQQRACECTMMRMSFYAKIRKMRGIEHTVERVIY